MPVIVILGSALLIFLGIYVWKSTHLKTFNSFFYLRLMHSFSVKSQIDAKNLFVDLTSYFSSAHTKQKTGFYVHQHNSEHAECVFVPFIYVLQIRQLLSAFIMKKLFIIKDANCSCFKEYVFVPSLFLCVFASIQVID